MGFRTIQIRNLDRTIAQKLYLIRENFRYIVFSHFFPMKSFYGIVHPRPQG